MTKKSVPNFVKFVHTFLLPHAIIYIVKPPIHYIVFATPHKKKYLLQKKTAYSAVFLLYINDA